MNVLLAPLLAAPMTEAVISVFVIVIALKLAFFTIKKVAINVALGIVTYMVCIYVLHIPMDIGCGVWALTVLFGPIPRVLAALYYGLYNKERISWLSIANNNASSMN